VEGYSDEASSCEYLLKQAMGFPMVAVGEGIYRGGEVWVYMWDVHEWVVVA
jgi:hypothetical protein